MKAQKVKALSNLLCIGLLSAPLGVFAQEGDDMYSSGYSTRKIEREQVETEQVEAEQEAPTTRYRSYVNNTYGEKHTATEVPPEIIEHYKRASRDRERRVIVQDSVRQVRAQEAPAPAPRHRERNNRRYYASGYVPHRGWRNGYWGSWYADPWYADPWYGWGGRRAYPYYGYRDPRWGYGGAYRHHHANRKHHKDRRSKYKGHRNKYKGKGHRSKRSHRSTQRRGRSGRR